MGYYLAFFHGSVYIMRSLFVLATTLDDTPNHDAMSQELPILDEQEDQSPPRSFYLSRIGLILPLASWIPVILSLVAGFNYIQAKTNINQADMDMIQWLK